MRPFLLLGHHRSGTNFLTDVLQAHPAVSLVDEPLSVHTRGFPETDLLRWTADEWDPQLIHTDLADYPMTCEMFHRLVTYLRKSDASTARGFKETILFEKMDWLGRAIPELQTILVVRDPRAVVASLMKHDIDALWGYGDALVRYHAQPGALHHLVETSTPLERSVSSWLIRFREPFQSPPDSLLVLRLEDVVCDGAATLDRMMCHLGLSVDDAQLKLKSSHEQESRGGMYSTYRRPEQVLHQWRQSLAREEIDYIEKRCTSELEWLGYG